MLDLSLELTEKLKCLTEIQNKIIVAESFRKWRTAEAFLLTLQAVLEKNSPDFVSKLESVSLPDILRLYQEIIQAYSQELLTGQTFLMFVAQRGPVELFKDILVFSSHLINQRRVDVSYDFKGGQLLSYEGKEDGYTALMYAVQAGQLQIAQLLIQNLADIYQENSARKTAFELAEDAKNMTMMELLRQGPHIQAEEILWSLIHCSKKEVIPLIIFQMELGLHKNWIMEELLRPKQNPRFHRMLLRYALQVDDHDIPCNALACYVRLAHDFFYTHDERAVNRVNTLLESLEIQEEKNFGLGTAVLSTVGKPSFISYSQSYGPQIEYPLVRDNKMFPL